MPRTVTIAAGKNGIVLPNGRSYNAGQTATLTDEQFAQIPASFFPGTVIDGGAVAGTTVATQTGLSNVTGTITASGQTVVADVRQASNVTIMVSGTFTGVNLTFEASLDSTNGTDGNWFGVQAARTNANTVEATSGVIATGVAYAWEMSANAYNFVRVRATAYGTGTATVTIARGVYATEPIPAIASHPVTVSGTATVAGTATVTPFTPTPYVLNTANTTNAVSVKGSAGAFFGFALSNPTATAAFLKIYQKATAPTVGTDVPAVTIDIPANSFKFVEFGPVGLRLSTGLAIAVTGAITVADTTAAPAGVQIVAAYL